LFGGTEEKQVPFGAPNDSQNSKSGGEGRSRFPEGMTERKARAETKAKAERKARAEIKAKANRVEQSVGTTGWHPMG
jgi:hypothetical protein